MKGENHGFWIYKNGLNGIKKLIKERVCEIAIICRVTFMQ